MKNYILRFFCLLSLLQTTTCLAGEQSPDQHIVTLLELSGIQNQLDQFPVQVNGAVIQAQQQQSKLSTEQLAHLSTVMSESFDPAVMGNDVKSYLQRNMTLADLTGALQWLESPLGRKITALEDAASRPEAMAEMQREAISLQEKSEKVALVSRLEVAVGAIDAVVAMAENVRVAVIISMMASAPGDQRLDIDQIKAMVEQQRPALRDAYGSAISLSMLYAYRSLSAAELNQYINFAESDIGRKYHSSAIAAMNYAVTKGGEKMGRKLGEALAKKPPS